MTPRIRNILEPTRLYLFPRKFQSSFTRLNKPGCETASYRTIRSNQSVWGHRTAVSLQGSCSHYMEQHYTIVNGNTEDTLCAHKYYSTRYFRWENAYLKHSRNPVIIQTAPWWEKTETSEESRSNPPKLPHKKNPWMYSNVISVMHCGGGGTMMVSVADCGGRGTMMVSVAYCGGGGGNGLR